MVYFAGKSLFDPRLSALRPVYSDATQLNSTSSCSTRRRVDLRRRVAIPDATQLNSTRRRVELS